MSDRFELIYKEIHSIGLEKRLIYVDKETGVNYLYVQIGYGGGMTPLLDGDGKPFITNRGTVKLERSSTGINPEKA